MYRSAMALRIKEVAELAADARAQIDDPHWWKEPVAAYTLILGAGFSVPSIPMTSTVVREAIGEFDAESEADERVELTPSQRERRSIKFWEEFNEEAPEDLLVELNPVGLPRDHGAAYRSLFAARVKHPKFFGTALAAAYLRKFQEWFLRPKGAEINTAHKLLARLIRSQERGALRHGRPFCHRILTTNFDTLLQQALQEVRVLYLIDSRPGLGFNPRDFDDPPDAIHLVYVHGMSLGYNPANTDDEIASLRRLNTATLTPILQRRGVIVIGFGGWKDTLLEALAACKRFPNGLYWCGVHAAVDAEAKLPAEVLALLRQSDDRFYVPLGPDGAAHLMRALANTLDPTALMAD